MQDLRGEQQEKIKLLNKAIELLKARGKDFASSEKEYRLALTKHMLYLRDEKVPVTIIADLAKGEQEIAGLKEKRDICKSLYESCLEAINAYKLEIRILDAQIEREWNLGGKAG